MNLSNKDKIFGIGALFVLAIYLLSNSKKNQETKDVQTRLGGGQASGGGDDVGVGSDSGGGVGDGLTGGSGSGGVLTGGGTSGGSGSGDVLTGGNGDIIGIRTHDTNTLNDLVQTDVEVASQQIKSGKSYILSSVPEELYENIDSEQFGKIEDVKIHYEDNSVYVGFIHTKRKNNFS